MDEKYIREIQQELISELTEPQSRFAVGKRGAIVNEKFFNFINDARGVLWCVYNRLGFEIGDRMQNNGIIEIRPEYVQSRN